MKTKLLKRLRREAEEDILHEFRIDTAQIKSRIILKELQRYKMDYILRRVAELKRKRQ